MTARIREFLKNRRESGVDEGPVLVVDLDVIRTNYQNFAKSLPDTRVFYAVKANPAPEVLSLLASLGSCFDTASVPEIEMALAAGATPDRISYGNTIKKERDVARAYQLGVRLFAVDCKAEVEKIARVAPGARVFCRILSDCVGAEWPLSRKFGCEPAMAADVLEHAHKLGLEAYGLSFHVGSQCMRPTAYQAAMAQASRALVRAGVFADVVDVGGVKAMGAVDGCGTQMDDRVRGPGCHGRVDGRRRLRAGAARMSADHLTPARPGRGLPAVRCQHPERPAPPGRGRRGHRGRDAG